MLNFFQSILDGIETAFTILINIFTGLFSVFSLIPTAFTFTGTAIGFLPSVISGFALAGIGICVVFHIIGR